MRDSTFVNSFGITAHCKTNSTMLTIRVANTLLLSLCFVCLSLLNSCHAFQLGYPSSFRHHRTERTHVTQLRCSWIPEEQKGLDQEEVKESLSRFVKSAPKGIMKAVQSQVLPVAKDIFVKNVLKQNGTSTEGTLPIQNEKKAADDSIVKANISPISLADAPDSSDQLQQLQMLMGLSLADELEEKTSRLLEQDNMRGTRSSSPSWMIERDEYNS